MKTYILYKTRQQAENAAKETAIKTNGYISQSSIDATSSDFEQMFYHSEITGEFSVYKIDASNGDEYYYAWIYESEGEYIEYIDSDLADYVAGSGTLEQIMQQAGINEDKYDSVNYIVGTLYTYICEDCHLQDAPIEEQEKEFDTRWNEAIDDLVALAKDLASDDEVISQDIDEINYASLIKRECQDAAMRAEKNFLDENVEYFATSAERIDGFAAWLVTFEDKDQTITSAAVVCDASYYDDNGKRHHYVCFIDDWQGSYPTSSADFADYHWVDEHWRYCDPSDGVVL